MTGQRSPMGVALDTTSIWWVNRGYDKNDGSIMRASKTGSAVTIIVGAQAEPSRIALDDEYVYWSAWGDGAIHRIHN